MLNVIILDLDNTLIYSTRSPKSDQYAFTSHEYSVYKRPNVDDFINYCFTVFDRVIIWSMGTHEYVHNIVNQLFDKQFPHLVLTRCDCDEYFKDIQQHRHLFSRIGVDIDRDHIVFVDDKPQFVRNIKHILPIVKYTHKHTYDASLQRIRRRLSLTSETLSDPMIDNSMTDKPNM